MLIITPLNKGFLLTSASSSSKITFSFGISCSYLVRANSCPSKRVSKSIIIWNAHTDVRSQFIVIRPAILHSFTSLSHHHCCLQFNSVQAHDRPVGWGHLLRCFWYQVAEMYGLAQLGHLKQPRSAACPTYNEQVWYSLLSSSKASRPAKLLLSDVWQRGRKREEGREWKKGEDPRMYKVHWRSCLQELQAWPNKTVHKGAWPGSRDP